MNYPTLLQILLSVKSKDKHPFLFSTSVEELADKYWKNAPDNSSLNDFLWYDHTFTIANLKHIEEGKKRWK
jgi:hypothetical protein